jgi:hypothetical protein
MEPPLPANTNNITIIVIAATTLVAARSCSRHEREVYFIRTKCKYERLQHLLDLQLLQLWLFYF